MREEELPTPPYDWAGIYFVFATNSVTIGSGLWIPKESLVFPGSEKKMLYLGPQKELEAHFGHVTSYFEPYKSIRVEIKSIGEL